MNICLVTANYPPMAWPCGLADFVRRYATSLHKAGVEVSVLTSNPKAETNGEFPVIVKPGNWGYRHRGELATVIREKGFDAFDLQYETFAFGHRARPFWFPLHFGRPKPARVLTMHSQGLPKRGGRLWRPLQIRPWDAIVFYSEPFLERMKARFPSRADRFHHLGFPSNIAVAVSPDLRSLVARVKAGWHDPRSLVMYFGHINAGRGIEEMLEAVKRLGERGLKPQVALVSQFDPQTNDYQRKLLADVAGMGLSDRVSFPGQLPSDQVAHLFQASDVVVLPFPEGASFKNGTLAAALGHGTAVVTTLTDLSEKALHGAVVGYPPGDVAALTERLAEMLTLHEKRAAISEAARKLGEELSWDVYTAKRIAIYDNVIRAGRSTPSTLTGS